MKNKKILIISIITCIILIVGTIAVMYLYTDVFKTEQQLFYKYLANIKTQETNNAIQYNTVAERMKSIKNSNYISTMNLDISINAINEQKQITNAQKLFSLTSDQIQNVSSKQNYVDFSITNILGMISKFKLKFLRDNNTYGLMEDNIVDRYIAVENANLKQLCRNLGASDEIVSEIPDSIDLQKELEKFEVEEATLKNLKTKYLNILYNGISEDKYYKTVNNDKTRTIGISLTEQEVINLTRKILETAQNDTILLNLIIEKIESANYEEFTIEDIRSKIQDALDELNDYTASIDPDFINIAFVVKGENILRIEIETNYKTKEADCKTNIASEIKHKEKAIIDLTEPNKITTVLQQDDKLVSEIILNYIYNEEKIEYSIGMKIENEEQNGLVDAYDASFQVTGYNTDNIVYILDLNIYDGILSSFGLNDDETKEKTVYNLKCVNDIKIKQDVEIPNLTKENSLKINDLNSEQLNNLFTAIYNKIQEVYFWNLENNTGILNQNSSEIDNNQNTNQQYNELEQQGNEM